MGRAINWEKKQEKIFELISSGEYTFISVAEAVGVNKTTLNHWWNRPQTQAEYELWLIKHGIDDRRSPKERTTPQAMVYIQNKAERFKESLKIGDEVRNHKYGERGKVVRKYPHCFTVITEGGYLSSYSYAAFNEFIKRSVEDGEQGE